MKVSGEMDREKEHAKIVSEMFTEHEIILHQYNGYTLNAVVDVFNAHVTLEYTDPYGFIYPIESENEYLDAIEKENIDE